MCQALHQTQYLLMFTRTHTETEAQRGWIPCPNHTTNNSGAGPSFSEHPMHPLPFSQVLSHHPNCVSKREIVLNIPNKQHSWTSAFGILRFSLFCNSKLTVLKPHTFMSPVFLFFQLKYPSHFLMLFLCIIFSIFRKLSKSWIPSHNIFLHFKKPT